MRTMKFYLLYVSAIITIFSCTKNKTPEKQIPTPIDFLTSDPWLLLYYGYDINKSGEVEKNEENTLDCEKDNTYIFNRDGSGIVNENKMICSDDERLSQFKWALTENDTVLDFYFNTARIVKLSEKRLYITTTTTDPELMVVFGH